VLPISVRYDKIPELYALEVLNMKRSKYAVIH